MHGVREATARFTEPNGLTASSGEKPVERTSYVLSSNPFLKPPTHSSSLTLLKASPCLRAFFPVLPSLPFAALSTVAS